MGFFRSLDGHDMMEATAAASWLLERLLLCNPRPSLASLSLSFSLPLPISQQSRTHSHSLSRARRTNDADDTAAAAMMVGEDDTPERHEGRLLGRPLLLSPPPSASERERGQRFDAGISAFFLGAVGDSAREQ